MSSFNDLNDNVKIKIKKIVVDILQEVSIIDPPVNYNLIYENDKLCKDFVNSKEIKSINFLRDLQNVNSFNFRGLLFIKNKQVLVIDDYGYEKRNNFVLGHEFGHWKIPSHKDLLYKCSEFDLSQRARKQLEKEANYFASELGFMGDVFLKYYKVLTYH